jgi:hypothetical protein
MPATEPMTWRKTWRCQREVRISTRVVELRSKSFVISLTPSGHLRACILAGGKRLWYDNDITYSHTRRNEHGRSRVDS